VLYFDLSEVHGQFMVLFVWDT